METKLSTGTAVMDWLLEGGYDKDSITTIYGPAGSGKTNLALLFIANSMTDKAVIYVDTEGSFSLARFKQICPDYKKALDRIIFLKPVSLEDQKDLLLKLKKMMNNKIGAVIIDTIATLYRVELSQTRNIFDANRNLRIQLGELGDITTKYHIPILITNQVYADLKGPERGKIKAIGGDIIKYASKTLIELQNLPDGTKKAILRKHRSLPEKEVIFRIKEDGLEEV
jgi:DNA repair protein RadB